MFSKNTGYTNISFFADVSWDPKGPRLAALVQAVQLRAESLLFIDDNPANRAEAAAFVPGLQIADETIIPTLTKHALLQGKPDPDLARLAQYRLLERRHGAQKAVRNAEDFLRASGITVAFVHDLEPHLDRVIELINRTNQLNFTKNRLPENPGEARAELLKLLARHNVQAGLLRGAGSFWRPRFRRLLRLAHGTSPATDPFRLLLPHSSAWAWKPGSTAVLAVPACA